MTLLEGLVAALALLAVLLVLILKDPLRQVAAGLSLRTERRLARGDWIQLEDGDSPAVVGKIVHLGWRAAILVAPEGHELIVPNTALATRVVRRFSHQEPWASRSVTVVCPAHVPPGQVLEALDDCLRDCPSVCQEPAPQ